MQYSYLVQALFEREGLAKTNLGAQGEVLTSLYLPMYMPHSYVIMSLEWGWNMENSNVTYDEARVYVYYESPKE